MEPEQKYKAGETVYAKSKLSVKLVVRRYARKIYYCTMPLNPEQQDQVFFENELTR